MHHLITRTGRFLRELRRRRVIRNSVAYVALALVLIEASGNILPPLGFPDGSVRLVIVACIVGFPVVAVLSWVYDIVEGRVVRTRPDPAAGPGSGRGEGDASAPAASAPVRHDRRHLVVLPFDDLTGDGARYFSEGITDDLTATLASIPSLRVTSRTSARACAGAGKTTVEIGQELRVGSILEGTVRRAGNRVRIVTRLVDAWEDQPIWGESYDREMEDVLVIQQEVARRIADALEAELSARSRDRLARIPTTDVAAYDVYLRGRFLWGQRTETSLEASLGELERALEADPEFAQAWAALSDSLITLALYGVREPATVLPRARDAARRALELDPGNGEARTALACARALHEWDWREAERGFEAAVEASPSWATAHQWAAMHLLAPLGRFGEAHRKLDRARELDPASPAIQASRAFLHLLQREAGEAEATCRATLEAHPTFALARLFLGESLLLGGRAEEAAEALETALSLRGRAPDLLAALARARAAGGDGGGGRELAAELDEMAGRRYVSPGRRGEVSLALGDRDGAAAHLARAVEVRAVDLVWLAVAPAWDGFREDPAYLRARDRLALPDVPGG